MKNARRKLEVPMSAAMPCKTRGGKYRETCRETENRETKCACNVEADESTRKRMEELLHEGHEDHKAGNGINSLNYYNLVRKYIAMLQAMNYTIKAAVDKELEKVTGMTADESQKQKKCDR